MSKVSSKITRKFSENICIGCHCVKSVHIRSFLIRISRIRTEYGNLLCNSPYSVRMRENADQRNSKYGHFSHSVFLSEEWICKSPIYRRALPLAYLMQFGVYRSFQYGYVWPKCTAASEVPGHANFVLILSRLFLTL